MKEPPRPSIFWTRLLTSNHHWVSGKTMKRCREEKACVYSQGRRVQVLTLPVSTNSSHINTLGLLMFTFLPGLQGTHPQNAY